MSSDTKPHGEYEIRRAAKEQEKTARESRRRIKKIVLSAVSVVAVFLIGWGVMRAVASGKPVGPDLSQSVPLMEPAHIAVGSPHPAYTSNPPASGPHYATTARKKFYDDSVPDEYLIHNLEHGDVWIAYHPRVGEEVKRSLKKLIRPKVIITPRQENEFDLSLVAWGRIDSFNLSGGDLDPPSAQRIVDFIKRYRNRGPEKIPAGAREPTFN